MLYFYCIFNIAFSERGRRERVPPLLDFLQQPDLPYNVFAFFNCLFQEFDPLDQLHHFNSHLIRLRRWYQQHQVD